MFLVFVLFIMAFSQERSDSLDSLTTLCNDPQVPFCDICSDNESDPCNDVMHEWEKKKRTCIYHPLLKEFKEFQAREEKQFNELKKSKEFREFQRK